MMCTVSRSSLCSVRPLMWIAAIHVFNAGAIIVAVALSNANDNATQRDLLSLPWQYTFTRDACQKQSFSSKVVNVNTSPLLVRNPSLSLCDASLGIAAIQPPTNTEERQQQDDWFLSSATPEDGTKNESWLLQALEQPNQGIAMSLWFQPHLSMNADSDDSMISYPIITLGRRRKILPNSPSSAFPNKTNQGTDAWQRVTTSRCDAQDFDFQLVQRGKYLEMYYRAATVSFFSPCQRMVLLKMPQLSESVLIDQANTTDSRMTKPAPQTTTNTSENFLEPRFGQVNHILIVLADGHQQVFLNANPSIILNEPFQNDLSHWKHPDASTDKVFGIDFFSALSSDSSPGLVWPGTIYQWSLYNNAATIFAEASQSRNAVETILRQGLPRVALPIISDVTVIVPENAPAPPIANVSKGIPSNVIQLHVTTIDDLVDDLLDSLNLTTSNASTTVSNSATSRPRSYLYITRLPNKGSVYVTNGTQMVSGSHDGIASETTVWIPVSTDRQIVYVPPPYEHSTGVTNFWNVSGGTNISLWNDFTTMEYCVLPDPVQSPLPPNASCATIHIQVSPVNEPPVAWPIPNVIQVYEGSSWLSSPKLLLWGTDRDDNDTIARVQITRPPLYGDLRLSVGSFRQDLLPDRTLLSDLQFSVLGSADPVYVKYTFHPNLFPGLVQDGNAQDSFTFRVADQNGTWSREELVQLQILSLVTGSVFNPLVSLDGVSKANSSFPEISIKSQAEILLHANDLSGYPRRLGFFLESVPPSDVGVLIRPAANQAAGSTGQPLLAGITIVDDQDDAPQSSRDLLLVFQPSSTFCESHRTSNEEIVFRAVAMDNNDQRVESVSSLAVQVIQIVCPDTGTEDDIKDDNALFLSSGLSTDPVKILQFGLERATSDPCRGAVFDPATTDLDLCIAAAIFTGIQVTSRKLSTPATSSPTMLGVNDTRRDSNEAVLVTVLSQSGFLTFNTLFWNRTLVVLNGRRVESSPNVTFVAFASDLNDIFSFLHFESYHAGLDEVEIIVRYGTDDGCNVFDFDLGVFAWPTPFLSNTEVPYVNRLCRIARLAIPVLVQVGEGDKSLPVDHTSTFVKSFPWQVLICFLGYPAIYFAWVQGGVWLKQASRRHQERKRNDEPLEDLERTVASNSDFLEDEFSRDDLESVRSIRATTGRFYPGP